MDFEDMLNDNSSSQGGGGLSNKNMMIIAGVAGLAILLLISRNGKTDDDGVDRTVYIPTTQNTITVLGEGASQNIDNSIGYVTNNNNEVINNTPENAVVEQKNEVQLTETQKEGNFTVEAHVDYLRGLEEQNNPGLNIWVQNQMEQYGYGDLEKMNAVENIDNEILYLNNKIAESETTGNSGLGIWAKAQLRKYGLIA